MSLRPIRLDDESKSVISVDAPHAAAVVGVQFLELRLLSVGKQSVIKINARQLVLIAAPVYTSILSYPRGQTCNDACDLLFLGADVCHTLNSA